jgi:uncharacterized protein YndB with AHSA1/START domain
MKNDFPAKAEIVIKAPVSKVWDALTQPEIIKKYLFGTTVETDWKEGSPIFWKGEWEGKTYEDKGTILKVIPQKFLQTTYWSGMSGLPDLPENYKKVTYELTTENGNTKLTVIQDNNANEEVKNHSEQNWKMVFETLKELLEK